MHAKSMWILEPCKGCAGTGKLGSGGMFTYLCEACDGFALTWVERCYTGTIGDS